MTRLHRIYTSKNCDIDPKKVRDMRGGIAYNLYHSLQYPGSLIFIDFSPGEPWPHACSYIAVENHGKGGTCIDEQEGWPPDVKIEFDDPNGYLAYARATAERALVKIRSCEKKHKGPIRDTGQTRNIPPMSHTCSDFGGCSKCEPLIVKVEVCDACGQEI